MNIIETNLTFGPLNKRESTKRGILHHTADIDCTIQDIHRWHKSYGWAGVGYHFFVSKDGKVYRGRPIDMIGSHAAGHNSDSIGICFEGNFEIEEMPEAQKEAGKELVAYVKSLYNITKIQKHSDVNSTACPGKNFPFKEIAEAKAETAKKVRYNTHVQTYGWQSEKKNGQMAGTVNQKKRVEAFVINSTDADFEYKGHIQGEGDTPWMTNGHVCGTMGLGKRLEAIWIKCNKPITYRVHIQGEGWMPWVTNGQMAGTTGKGLRLEAIEIKFAES